MLIRLHFSGAAQRVSGQIGDDPRCKDELNAGAGKLFRQHREQVDRCFVWLLVRLGQPAGLIERGMMAQTINNNKENYVNLYWT